MDILLISGVPATGKTYFGAWLESNHRYLHIDIEEKPPGRLDSYRLRDAWNACFSAEGAKPFMKLLRRLGRPIALSWGFPPEYLGGVRRLKAAGVALWWFDADRVVARTAFLERGGGIPVECFDVQMDKIEGRSAEIKATFDPNVIETLRSDGSHLTLEKIYEEMFKGKKGQFGI